MSELHLGWKTVVVAHLYLSSVKFRVHLSCFTKCLRNIEGLADLKGNAICCVRRHKRINNRFILEADLGSVIFHAGLLVDGFFLFPFEKGIFYSYYQLLLSVTFQW